MDENIKKRFSVLPGYDHKRDGIPIPQPKTFRYDVMIDDVVLHSGTLLARNQEDAENEIETDILPTWGGDRYNIDEIK